MFNQKNLTILAIIIVIMYVVHSILSESFNQPSALDGYHSFNSEAGIFYYQLGDNYYQITTYSTYDKDAIEKYCPKSYMLTVNDNKVKFACKPNKDNHLTTTQITYQNNSHCTKPNITSTNILSTDNNFILSGTLYEEGSNKYYTNYICK
jgi:hypothetical protein